MTDIHAGKITLGGVNALDLKHSWKSTKRSSRPLLLTVKSFNKQPSFKYCQENVY